MTDNEPTPPSSIVPGLPGGGKSTLFQQIGSGKTLSYALGAVQALQSARRAIASEDIVQVRVSVACHCDVQPRNVLITDHDFHLSDFGLARPLPDAVVLVDQTAGVTLTSTASTLSPGYSPSLKDMLWPSYQQPLRTPDPLGSSAPQEGTDVAEPLGVDVARAAMFMHAMRPSLIPVMSVTIHLDRYDTQDDQPGQLRADLLRFIRGILAVICFMLVQLRAALQRGLSVRNFVLVLVATSRRYGRRSEPDDYLPPAHQSLSGIGRELSVRR